MIQWPHHLISIVVSGVYLINTWLKPSCVNSESMKNGTKKLVLKLLSVCRRRKGFVVFSASAAFLFTEFQKTGRHFLRLIDDLTFFVRHPLFSSVVVCLSVCLSVLNKPARAIRCVSQAEILVFDGFA